MTQPLPETNPMTDTKKTEGVVVYARTDLRQQPDGPVIFFTGEEARIVRAWTNIIDVESDDGRKGTWAKSCWLTDLPAHTPDTLSEGGGELVAWQVRRVYEDGRAAKWGETEQPEVWRDNPNYEVRALYASPAPVVGMVEVPPTGREHDLKTWREPFAAVRGLWKPWELRLDDRDYQVGDILNLREWDEESDAEDQYTGEIEHRLVTWLLRGPAFGLPDGYVIMSMVPFAAAPAIPSPAQVGDGGLKDIAAERQRQVEVEGWTPDHDDAHPDGSMALAGACYAAGRPLFVATQCAGTAYEAFTSYLPAWPWADRWWKPKDRRRDLVRAGALIVAEIERLDRTLLNREQGR